MNELIQNSFNVPTMSSREIAELCDKEHRHVKRDIDVMTEQLEIDASKFGHIYLDSMNLTLSMTNFHSPKLGRPPIPMNKMGKP